MSARRRKANRIALSVAIALAGGCGGATYHGPMPKGSGADLAGLGDGGPPGSPVTVDRKQVGTPGFDLVDFQQVSMPGGSMADSYAMRPSSMIKVLPKHVFDMTDNVYPSGEAHPAPYDHEIGDGVVAAKFASRTAFPPGAWTPPENIALLLMIVPNATAPTGSSLDFAKGPILPNARFPMKVSGALLLGATTVDMAFDQMLPAPTMLHDPAMADGFSHVPLLFAESADNLMPAQATGSFTWKIQVRDKTGNGWDVTVSPLDVGVAAPQDMGVPPDGE